MQSLQQLEKHSDATLMSLGRGILLSLPEPLLTKCRPAEHEIF